jgi:hypothetical protein
VGHPETTTVPRERRRLAQGGARLRRPARRHGPPQDPPEVRLARSCRPLPRQPCGNSATASARGRSGPRTPGSAPVPREPGSARCPPRPTAGRTTPGFTCNQEDRAGRPSPCASRPLAPVRNAATASARGRSGPGCTDPLPSPANRECAVRATAHRRTTTRGFTCNQEDRADLPPCASRPLAPSGTRPQLPPVAAGHKRRSPGSAPVPREPGVRRARHSPPQDHHGFTCNEEGPGGCPPGPSCSF